MTTGATAVATVLLTHGAGRLEDLAPTLRAAGHRVVHAPLVVTRPRPEAADALRALTTLPWLLFASRSAVDAWTAAGLRFPPDGPSLGAVGPATAAALERAGGTPALIGRGTARDLAYAFLKRHQDAPAAGPVGLPRGDRSRPDLPDALVAAGVAVRTVTAYVTRTAPWRDPGPVAAVVFASPSAVQAAPDALLARAACVALGPTTADALRARGAAPWVAERPDADAVRAALTRAGVAPNRDAAASEPGATEPRPAERTSVEPKARNA